MIQKNKLIPLVLVLLLFAAACLYYYSEGNRTVAVIYKGQKLTRTLRQLKTLQREQHVKHAVYTKSGDTYRTDRIKGGKSLLGVVLYPPELSITDIKPRILEYTRADNKVLLIYVDGLGYSGYERLISEGAMPKTAAVGEAEAALTVFPPITDVAFTSMATGVAPYKHGIRKRGDGELKVDTIFDVLKAEGKSSKLVEGDIKILRDEADTIFNIDENKNGTIDDEIFKTAMTLVNEKLDFLMVHFHSFDDTGHEFGPYSTEAKACAEVLDGYIGELQGQWTGITLITADHGMHEAAKAGGHGAFIPEDMFIPIIDTSKDSRRVGEQ